MALPALSLQLPPLSAKFTLYFLDIHCSAIIVFNCGEKWVYVVFKHIPEQSGAVILFNGVSEIHLDAKGRMAIPAKHRDVLLNFCGGKLVVTVDITDQCLRVYPLPVWEELAARLEALPANNPAVRKIQRKILGYASDLELDTNGRILLPQPLREYAALEKELVLVGMGKKFELWSEVHWRACIKDAVSGDFALPDEIASISF